MMSIHSAIFLVSWFVGNNLYNASNQGTHSKCQILFLFQGHGSTLMRVNRASFEGQGGRQDYTVSRRAHAKGRVSKLNWKELVMESPDITHLRFDFGSSPTIK